jgi:hypothetical protein
VKHALKTELTEAQREFLRSREMFLAMFGGYGSGKTHAIILKLLQLASKNKGVPGGMVCPSIKMFKRDVYPLLSMICAEQGIEFTYHKGDAVIEFPWTKTQCYIFHGEDDGESIKGPNLGWMLMNEMTLLSWNTFKAAISRVRLKNCPLPQIAGSGTPEDFNWAFDKFIDKPLKNSKVIYANTRKNRFAAGFYVDMLLSSYDELAAQQYVDGMFVPTAGKRALYQFDRRKHVREVNRIPDEGEIWVSCDFNVFPMAATIWQYIPGDPTPLRGIDEVRIEKADTWELAQALSYKIGPGWEQAQVFPDGMGGMQRRTTGRGGVTDISILRDHGFQNLYFKSKLSVRDCMNAANNLFHKGMVVVSPKCEEFIRDAERCTLKAGVYELDKSDPQRTHWLDGFKNMADYRFPVVKPYTQVTGRKLR